MANANIEKCSCINLVIFLFASDWSSVLCYRLQEYVVVVVVVCVLTNVLLSSIILMIKNPASHKIYFNDRLYYKCIIRNMNQNNFT